MDKITIKVKDLTQVSDGYHTIEELYKHRHLLFINLAFEMSNHYDVYYSESDIPGLFLLYIILPTGQISYHIPNNYLVHVKKLKKIPLSQVNWDGHTSVDVLNRLGDMLK